MKNLSLAAALLAAITSCATTVELDYAYDISSELREEPDGSFTDGRFTFDFIAIPTGVLFSITNKTGEPAYLRWDDCYFVEPNGNTYNALNTDLIKETDVNLTQAAKSQFLTQVPSKATVTRFTTATTNAEAGSVVTSVEVANMLTTANYTWSGSGWSWSTPSASALVSSYADSFRMVKEEDYWYAKRYYPTKKRGSHQQLIDDLDSLTREISSDRPMGLGLCLVSEDEATNYRFDFTIDAVVATRTIKDSDVRGGKTKSQKVEYGISQKSNEWAWQFPEGTPPHRLTNQ